MTGIKHRAAGTGYRLLPIAVILCGGTLLANPATATESCPIVPPPLQLPAQSDTPSTLLADHVSLHNGVAVAQGHVRLEQQDQALESTRLRYDRDNATVQTDTHLEYIQPDMYLTASSAQVNIDNDTGQFSDANYTFITTGGRGTAAHVHSTGKGHYLLTDASYSTCAGTTKAWNLTATSLILNQETGRGEAYNSVMHFFGVPVFYMPYMNFPIDDKRHTGFLTPVYGSSNDSGYEVALPYYINLAPNYDATVIPRYMSERGLQLTGQLRYLTAHNRGELDGSWLPDDNKYGASRNFISFRHIGKLAPHLGITARYAKVSDNDYFDDLDTYLTTTSHSHLVRNVKLSYENTGVSLSVLAEKFQNLNRYDYGPYQRLPQVRLDLESPTAPFYAGIDAEYSDFKKQALEAQRVDLRPHVNWSVDHGGWFARSEAALRYTHYRFDNATYDDNTTGHNTTVRGPTASRSIPVFSAGGGLRFVRALHNGWQQTLEPQLFYLYKGYKDQSHIPLFDTAVPDLNFGRLFQHDRFTGADLIADANQITVGVTSQLIAPNDGNTVLAFELGKIIAFQSPRITWSGNTETGFHNNGSDYFAGIDYTPNDHFGAGLVVQYDAQSQDLNRAIARIHYRHDSGLRVSLAWRRYKNFRELPRTAPGYALGKTETLEQVQLGAAFPVGNAVDVFGQWDYSLQQHKAVNLKLGLEYRPSCCWATRFSWQSHIDHSDGSYSRAFMLEIVLRGLTAFGKD